MARIGRDIVARERRDEQRRRNRERQAAEQQRRSEAQQQRAQQIYDTQTGLGVCPKCGSGNIQHVRKTENNSSAQATACCLGCFVFAPLLLLLPFLQKRVSVAKCQSCKHTWPI